jgi:hypothetical protein
MKRTPQIPSHKASWFAVIESNEIKHNSVMECRPLSTVSAALRRDETPAHPQVRQSEVPLPL